MNIGSSLNSIQNTPYAGKPAVLPSSDKTAAQGLAGERVDISGSSGEKAVTGSDMMKAAKENKMSSAAAIAAATLTAAGVGAGIGALVGCAPFAGFVLLAGATAPWAGALTGAFIHDQTKSDFLAGAGFIGGLGASLVATAKAVAVGSAVLGTAATAGIGALAGAALIGGMGIYEAIKEKQ
ncbi:MAG: hypothetical protein LWY06_11770 [Firmicutes bacterium]|nr:hypothetical protein [Bacillota bacterium]